MSKDKNNNDADYQAYLERLSAPPCPRKITEDELKKITAQKKSQKKNDDLTA